MIFISTIENDSFCKFYCFQFTLHQKSQTAMINLFFDVGNGDKIYSDHVIELQKNQSFLRHKRILLVEFIRSADN